MALVKCNCSTGYPSMFAVVTARFQRVHSSFVCVAIQNFQSGFSKNSKVTRE